MAFVRGKPQLATWSNTDNLLRLFELDASDIFVERGNWEIIPVTTGTTPPSYNNALRNLRLGFFKDFLWAVVRRGESVGVAYFNTYFKSSALSSVGSKVSGAMNGFGIADCAINKSQFYMFPNREASTGGRYGIVIDESGVARNKITNHSITTPSNVNSRSIISPDGKVYMGFFLNVGYIRWIEWDGSVDSEGYPTYAALAAPAVEDRTVIPFSTTTVVIGARWTNDSKFMILAQKQNDTENGWLSVVQYDSTQATPGTKLTIQTIAMNGHPERIAIHPSGKYIAVGVRNNAGTTYRMEIYRRMGKYLQLLSTTPDAGRSIDFTQDGRFLIDSVSHKAWNFDVGTAAISTNSTILQNVPTSAQMQTLSDHVDILGSSTIYDVFMDRTREGTVDEVSLKLIPLSNSATFDAEHTTVSEVTDDGAYQQVTVDFPVGGVDIVTSALSVPASGTIELRAQDLLVQVTEAITFTKGLIIDGVTGDPVLFIDFGKTIEPALKSTVKFSLSEYAIATYRVV